MCASAAKVAFRVRCRRPVCQLAAARVLGPSARPATQLKFQRRKQLHLWTEISSASVPLTRSVKLLPAPRAKELQLANCNCRPAKLCLLTTARFYSSDTHLGGLFKSKREPLNIVLEACYTSLSPLSMLLLPLLLLSLDAIVCVAARLLCCALRPLNFYIPPL